MKGIVYLTLLEKKRANEAGFFRISYRLRKLKMNTDHQYDSLLSRIRERIAHPSFEDRIHMRVPRPSFPPATEEQIRDTEQQLGFPLPPLLRLLYTEVANGGFGPPYGIVGTPGGFCMSNPHPYMPDLDLVQSYQQEVSEARGLIRLEDYETVPYTQKFQYKRDNFYWEEGERQSYRYLLPPNVWPEYLLPLCFRGCTCYTYVDAMSGRLFNEQYECEAASLEEWFERWLAGERV